MNKDFLEKRLHQKAQRQAFEEFRKSQETIQYDPILSKIFKYKGQFTICGYQLVPVYISAEITDIETAINNRADKIYEEACDDLLSKIDNFSFLFDEIAEK